VFPSLDFKPFFVALNCFLVFFPLSSAHQAGMQPPSIQTLRYRLVLLLLFSTIEYSMSGQAAGSNSDIEVHNQLKCLESG
jgi:hypothetical protein